MRTNHRIVPASNAGERAPTAAADTASPSMKPGFAPGPLVVSAKNPRYFTLGAGRAADEHVVYLTGSHVWNNFHDGLGPGAPCASERNDFGAYLSFLEAHGHNFIRLWRWEHFKSQVGGGEFHACMTPQPWPRTGTGPASDGEPRFDLSSFDPAYFDRLRDRVIEAGNKGIYVSVMLFDGFCLTQCPAPDNVAGHPFAAGNNGQVPAVHGAARPWMEHLGRSSRGRRFPNDRKQLVSRLQDLPQGRRRRLRATAGAARRSASQCPVPIAGRAD